MILAAIFLLLVVALVAKMIYDVKMHTVDKLERARLQIIAGIKIDEELIEKVRKQNKIRQEKLKKKAQKTAKDKSNETLPLTQTAAEKVLADLGELERIQQRKANK